MLQALGGKLVGQIFFQRRLGVFGRKGDGLGRVHAHAAANAHHGLDVLLQAEGRALLHPAQQRQLARRKALDSQPRLPQKSLQLRLVAVCHKAARGHHQHPLAQLRQLGHHGLSLAGPIVNAHAALVNKIVHFLPFLSRGNVRWPQYTPLG